MRLSLRMISEDKDHSIEEPFESKITLHGAALEPLVSWPRGRKPRAGKAQVCCWGQDVAMVTLVEPVPCAGCPARCVTKANPSHTPQPCDPDTVILPTFYT